MPNQWGEPTPEELESQFGITSLAGEPEEEFQGDEGYNRYAKDLAIQRANFQQFGSYYEKPESGWYSPGSAPGLTGGQLKPNVAANRPEWEAAQSKKWGAHVVDGQWVWLQEPNVPKTLGSMVNPQGAINDWQSSQAMGLGADKSAFLNQTQAKPAYEQARQGAAYNQFVGGELPRELGNTQFGSFDEFAQKAADMGYSIVDIKRSTEESGQPYDQVTIGKQDQFDNQWGNFINIAVQDNPQGGINTWSLTNVAGEGLLPGEAGAGQSSKAIADQNYQNLYGTLQKAWMDPSYRMAYSQWGSLSDKQKEQLIGWMDSNKVPADTYIQQDWMYFLPPEMHDRSYTITPDEWKAMDGQTKNYITDMLAVQGRELADFVIDPEALAAEEAAMAEVQANKYQPKANVSYRPPVWR